MLFIGLNPDLFRRSCIHLGDSSTWSPDITLAVYRGHRSVSLTDTDIRSSIGDPDSR